MKIIAICGKSSSGKDYLSKKLLEEPIVERYLTYTDRPMRAKEIEGVEYFFKSKEEFDKLIEDGIFVEYQAYNAKDINDNVIVQRYGSPKHDKSFFENDKLYLAILTVDGVKAFCDYYGKENISTYYIDTPDDIREARCRTRDKFNAHEWSRRLKTDAEDFSDEKMANIKFKRLDGTEDVEKLKKIILKRELTKEQDIDAR